MVEHMIERVEMWDEEITTRGKKRVEELMEAGEEKERLRAKKLMAEERQRLEELERLSEEESGKEIDQPCP